MSIPIDRGHAVAGALQAGDLIDVIVVRKGVAGYVATVEDLLNSRQFAAREFFQSLDHPQAGEARYPGSAFALHGSSWQLDRAPLLGEHNEDIYGHRLGYSNAELTHLRGLGVI